MKRCLKMEYVHIIIALAICTGVVYFAYSLAYASLQFQENDWVLRPALSIEPLYKTDPDLRAIHNRQVEEADKLSSEVSIVTAYFNLGPLNKGGMFGSYTPDRYKTWMSVFGRINNPLIVFTDSLDVQQVFLKARAHFPPDRTKVFVVNRTSLWSFSLAPKIDNIFSQPGYPYFSPNTVKATYSCVMHAKFELVSRVIKEKLFFTKYISWLDIGLFRAVIDETHIFRLVLPPGFDPDKVAYSQEHQFSDAYTPYQIISENLVWVSGAMFLGRPEVVYTYVQDYMKAVELLIENNMMSTDQQVIYIMYLSNFSLKPRVEIQTYTMHSTDDWFYLGYLIKDLFDIKIRRAVPITKFINYIL